MADTKITEKYQYKTSIITAYNGYEQRISLRDSPRHFLSYDYTAMKSFDAQWLRAVLRMKQSTPLYIPMWHNPLYLVEDSLKGNNYIKIEETSMYNLDRCSAIVVFVDDSVKNVNTYYSTNMYGDGGIVGIHPDLNKSLNKKSAHVYPLIKCSIQPITGLDYVYSNGSNVTINFEDLLEESPVKVPNKYLIDYYDIYSGMNRYKIPYTYGGENVLTLSPQWVDDGSVTLDIEKQTTKLDNDIGIVSYDSKNNLSYDKSTYNWYLMNKSEINNMIKFFHRIKGMYKSFYMPSWVNDFSPCFDIKAGQNYIYTEFDSLYKYYLSNNRKKKIIIFTKGLKSYIVDILSLTFETIADKKYGKLLLANPITVDLSLSNIKMISYFNHVRLDSDELQLNYESTQVAQVTLTTKEVDDI